VSKPNIFIVGQSGSGKSTSLRNLDPNRTIIINTEGKALPFRGAVRFTKNIVTSTYDGFMKAMQRALQADADTIVVDSFTSLQEQVLMHCKAVKKGFDVWNEYATLIYQILQMTKASSKYVVFLGLGEPLQDETGSIKWRG
jgi:ABC-type glutathione transport system ATPase component